MTQERDNVGLFNQSLRTFFTEALRLSLRDPGMAVFAYQTVRRQSRAEQVRQAWEERGIHVPPLLIASITKRCNLQCKGCYARAQDRAPEAEMSAEKLHSIIAEAQELGIAIILLAGGEPLTRPEILDITAAFPGIIFPMFTNGLLIGNEVADRLRKQRNVIPVLSVEGHLTETDARRGQGVYGQVLKAMERLEGQGVFFGTSITLTKQNHSMATAEPFVKDLIARGCRLFFYVDYVPAEPGTECLVLASEQRAATVGLLASLQASLPGLFVAFPGDEELYGGCLAAGRGFVHISPAGRVEPCPFAPFSDASLQDLSLREALQSRFMRAIREDGEHLGETRGGCALWTRRNWVRSLLQPAAEVGN